MVLFKSNTGVLYAKNFFTVCLSVFLFANPLSAHHAREYIVITSYETGNRGDLLAGLSYDRASKGEFYDWEITPALLYSLTDRIMFETHTHFKKEKGLDMFWEAFTIGSQLKLSQAEDTFFDLGLNLSFEFPTSQSREKIDGERLMESRLIFSKELPRDVNICWNLICEQVLENDKETTLSLGMGTKTVIMKNLEGGVEIMGVLESESAWEMIVGRYYSVNEKTVLKGGFGLGLSDAADDDLFSIQLIIGF